MIIIGILFEKKNFFRNGKFDQFFLTFNILNIRYVLYNLILFVHIYFHLWTYLYVVRIFLSDLRIFLVIFVLLPI